MPNEKLPRSGWRFRMHEVIFEADTPAGKLFDVALFVGIIVSVTAVVLESVPGISRRHQGTLDAIEWTFTILFTLEYLLRLTCVGRPLAYARSFFGIVDLLAIVPTYLSLLIPGAHSLLVFRALRLFRIFRVLKLVRFVGEANVLATAIRGSARKIIVFLGAVMTIVLIMGTLMYLIEGDEHGFGSIPVSVYWAIVTMTTVGYGDIAPETVPGRILASAVMILGYAIIAVPTGIFTVEMVGAFRRPVSGQACPECSAEGHDVDATYCKYCSAKL